jgi:hypothetical protein
MAPPAKLSPAQVAEVRRLYQEGEAVPLLAARYGVSRTLIYSKLNIGDATRRNKLDAEEVAELCRRYQTGEPAYRLAREFGVAPESARGLITRRGIPMRTHSTANLRHALNHEAFSIPTRDALYWAGFMFADGNLQRAEGRAPMVRLHLAVRDADHVARFRGFLGSTHKLGERPSERGTSATILRVRSERLCRDLEHLGMRNPGLESAACPEARRSPDFWRGVVDGDGSLGLAVRPNGRRFAYLQLVGGEALMAQFAEFVREVCPRYRGQGTRPHGNIHRVSLGGRTARALAGVLYGDGGVALPRKRARATEILGIGP